MCYPNEQRQALVTGSQLGGKRSAHDLITVNMGELHPVIHFEELCKAIVQLGMARWAFSTGHWLDAIDP